MPFKFNPFTKKLDIVTTPVTDTNDKVKISEEDTTTGFLEDKIVAGTNVQIVKSDIDGNEILTISSTDIDTNDKVKISSDDTTPSYLEDKIDSSDGSIILTKLNPSGNEVLDLSINTNEYLQFNNDFVENDWLGTSPYQITYLSSVHLQGATKNLSVYVKKDNGDNTYNEVILDVMISDLGDVTIYSNDKFDGNILIGKLSGLGNITNNKITPLQWNLTNVDNEFLVAGYKGHIISNSNNTIVGYRIYNPDENLCNVSFDVRIKNGSKPDAEDSVVDGNYLTLVDSASDYVTDLSSWSSTSISVGDYVGLFANINMDCSKLKIELILE